MKRIIGLVLALQFLTCSLSFAQTSDWTAYVQKAEESQGQKNNETAFRYYYAALVKLEEMVKRGQKINCVANDVQYSKLTALIVYINCHYADQIQKLDMAVLTDLSKQTKDLTKSAGSNAAQNKQSSDLKKAVADLRLRVYNAVKALVPPSSDLIANAKKFSDGSRKTYEQSLELQRELAK